MAIEWYPKSCTPTFKLQYGISESGSVITKSVSIRNINPSALNNTTIRGYVNNIINAFISANAFEYNIYKIEASGKYELEEAY